MTGWVQASKFYLDRRMITILLLGFSSGLPFLLVFSTLSVWLTQEGVSLAAIGFFSAVRTPYDFKFLWAPLIDRVPLPILSRLLGRRRGWTLAAQIALMASIFVLASTDPGRAPLTTAFFAFVVAFTSASQDIVIDAYRIELLEEHEQGHGAGSLVLGYRIGILTSGAGALWLASAFTWSEVYSIMGVLVVVGMITVLLSPEPKDDGGRQAADAEAVRKSGELERRLPHGAARTVAWLYLAVVEPFRDFATREGWLAILLFVMLYKLGDAYLGVMANPFYIKMGFSVAEIASVSKVFGFGATLIGALLGGIMVIRIGIFRSLLYCGILQALSNLVFAAQAAAGHNIAMLVVTIAAENVTGGMATAAFVAYLSSLCNTAYTATQYALLTSFMAFSRDVLAASSGVLAERVDWITFFVITAILALPALVILIWMMRRYGSEPAGTESRAD
jgi:PAT family beta-lactamase induction signal transducer AmpG